MTRVNFNPLKNCPHYIRGQKGFKAELMRDESRFEEVFKNGKKLKINSGEIIYNSGGSNSHYYQIVCWNPGCRVEYALLDRNINILKRETLKFEDIEINYEQKTIKTPHFQYNQ